MRRNNGYLISSQLKGLSQSQALTFETWNRFHGIDYTQFSGDYFPHGFDSTFSKFKEGRLHECGSPRFEIGIPLSNEITKNLPWRAHNNSANLFSEENDQKRIFNIHACFINIKI